MKIEKAECSYQVTECDLKFGEQIVLDGELLIPASVLDKIRAEIENIDTSYYRSVNEVDMTECADDIKHWILQVIDKYKAESEGDKE